MLDEVRSWAQALSRVRTEVRRVGLFGSYCRDQHAPGSDLDILILVSHSPEPVWFLRPHAYDAESLSLPADLFVYTESEAERMAASSGWFRHVLDEVLWLLEVDQTGG